MREIIQMGVVVISMTFFLGACSGSKTMPAPIVAKSSSVAIEKPLDLSRYNENPCDSVPGSVDSESQFEKRETQEDLHAISAGSARQPACVLTHQGGYPRLTVWFFFDVQPIEFFNAMYPLVRKIDDVRSYPAGLLKATYVTPGPQLNLCSTVVDVAENQGIEVAYDAGQQLDVDSCAWSRTVVERVLDKLTSSH